MSKLPRAEFHKQAQRAERESTLIPMLIGGLLLALVGMLVIVMFV